MMADLTPLLEYALISAYFITAVAAGFLAYRETGKQLVLETIQERERVTSQFEIFLVGQLIMLFGFVSYITGGMNHIGSLLDITYILGIIYIGLIFIGCLRWVIQGW